MSDTNESRIGLLEQNLAALKERVEVAAIYVTRDIAGLTSSVDAMRRQLQDQAERDAEREKADRRANFMQVIQVVGIVATFIGLLIAYLSLKSATGN